MPGVSAGAGAAPGEVRPGATGTGGVPGPGASGTGELHGTGGPGLRPDPGLRPGPRPGTDGPHGPGSRPVRVARTPGPAGARGRRRGAGFRGRGSRAPGRRSGSGGSGGSGLGPGRNHGPLAPADGCPAPPHRVRVGSRRSGARPRKGPGRARTGSRPDRGSRYGLSSRVPVPRPGPRGGGLPVRRRAASVRVGQRGPEAFRHTGHRGQVLRQPGHVE